MSYQATAFAPLVRQSSRSSSRLFSSESSNHVGIIGGGLAGLSTAYQLLQKSPSIDVTIIDKARPGIAGASSIAGGLLHPLSPRGKLAHLGLEGLTATNNLLNAAVEFEKDTILRNEIYRVALNDEHVSTLKQTGIDLPNLTQWLDSDEVGWSESEVVGALRLHAGCKVVHIPTYLRGLWSACRSIGSGEKEWLVESDCTSEDYDWEQRLASFDTVVLCAGAGLFQNSIIQEKLPVSLVLGQSIEMTLGESTCEHAMLSGKYVSPLLEKNRVLIGATQEFKEGEQLDAEDVEAKLKEVSFPFASSLWNDGTIDKITSGYRVQSERGSNGRIPIVGRFDTPIHKNAWIFTGLGSRGLLYHGVFGDMLTSMILNLDGKEVERSYLNWWHKK